MNTCVLLCAERGLDHLRYQDEGASANMIPVYRRGQGTSTHRAHVAPSYQGIQYQDEICEVSLAGKVRPPSNGAVIRGRRDYSRTPYYIRGQQNHQDLALGPEVSSYSSLSGIEVSLIHSKEGYMSKKSH